MKLFIPFVLIFSAQGITSVDYSVEDLLKKVDSSSPNSSLPSSLQDILDIGDWACLEDEPGKITPTLYEFTINNNSSAILQVSGHFSDENSLMVVDNDTVILSTLTTDNQGPYPSPEIPIDDSPLGGKGNQIVDYQNKEFVMLPPGTHSIRIFLQRSLPTIDSRTFIRVDTLYKHCSYGDYTIITPQDNQKDLMLPMEETGDNICTINGLELVEVTHSSQITELALALKNCVGPMTMGRVKSQLYGKGNESSCQVLALKDDNINDSEVILLDDCSMQSTLPSICYQSDVPSKIGFLASGRQRPNSEAIEKPDLRKPYWSQGENSHHHRHSSGQDSSQRPRKVPRTSNRQQNAIAGEVTGKSSKQ